MTVRAPAEIGIPLEDVDTPALLIDLDAFERNLQRMAVVTDGTPVRLRPHAKTHKSPLIALRQTALGAVGVCCQKVSEAEAMVHGGVRNVLITNEIVGPKKLARLAALAKEAEIAVCVDDRENARALSEVAVAFGIHLPVLVEVNVGADRCGVEPGEPVLDLARQILASPGLRFAGIQAYYGSAQHIREFEARRAGIRRAAEKVERTLDVLRRGSIVCDLVTGAGTGTYPFEIESGLFTEIQPGSYIFMDADYGRNLDENASPRSHFEQSLFVYTTVMSKRVNDRAVVDAGLKALSVDSGMPFVHELPDIEYTSASDEHGKLVLHDRNRTLHVGDKLRLVPGHCDPTVNLFDWFVGIRGSRVEALWPITARGASL